MKIIADMGENKLVEISKDELALLLGYRSQWEEEFRTTQKFPIGRIVDISKFARVSESVKNMNTGILKNAAQSITSAQDKIKEAIEAIEEINCFEKLKGDE